MTAISSTAWAGPITGLAAMTTPRKTLEAAVLLVPGDPTINDHLGDALWKAGRKMDARFQWNHALTFAHRGQRKDRDRTEAEERAGRIMHRIRHERRPWRRAPRSICSCMWATSATDGFHPLQSLAVFTDLGDVWRPSRRTIFPCRSRGPLRQRLGRRATIWSAGGARPGGAGGAAGRRPNSR